MSKLKSIELYGGGIKTNNGPNHVPSLDGFIIDENGNANFNSIKVREFFEVDELIYNKIKVSEDEQWITAAGKIETVEPYSINGGTTGYKVTFKADNPDTYIPPFNTNDILKGIFCNFQSDESPKLYVTHYFKVDSNGNDGSSVILEPYETTYLDTTIVSQPYPEMVVVRIGNTHDTKRQKSILISAKNGNMIFYDGVNSPKIKGENVKMLLGNIDPENIDIPIPAWANIPGLKGYSAVMENVIIKGKFFQIPGDDVDAEPQPLVTYEGIFDADVKYYKNNTVTHEGNIYILNAEHPKTTIAPFPAPDEDTDHWGLYLAKGKDGSIGKDGSAVIFKYGPTYDTSDWHDNFKVTDKYMQQFDIYGIKIGKPVQIVGEKGDGSDYFDFTFIRTEFSNIDPATDISADAWEDAPPLPTTGKKFLWCKMQKMQWNENVEGNYIAVGNPTYTLMSAESYYNLNVTNDNCSVNELILEDANKLRDFTFNTIEFFKDGEIITGDYTINVKNTNCETFCDKLNKTIYVTKVLNKAESAFYEISVNTTDSPTYTLKCTCNVALNGKDGKVATVYEIYPSVYTIRYNYDGTAPSAVSFSLKVKKFNETAEILSTYESVTNEGLKLQYSFNNKDWTNITSLSNPVTFVNDIEKVHIKLLSSKDVILDTEEIPIVLNGAPGQKGESIKVKYSQTSDKTISNWHDIFDIKDLFMWQYNDITNQFIGEPIRVVGEKGEPGNGSDYIDFSFYRSASSTKVPNNLPEENWEDAPPAPEGDNKYLWCKMQKYLWNEEDSTHVATGDPTYTLLTAEEAETSYTLNMMNDNCSVFNSLSTNQSELKDITYNNSELFYGLSNVDIFTLSITDMANCTAIIDPLNKKCVYVTSVTANERSFSYVVNAHVNNAIVSKCKCTGTIVSDASIIYELNTNISVLKYNDSKLYSGPVFDMDILKIKFNSYSSLTSNLTAESLKVNIKLYSNSDTASVDIDSTSYDTLAAYNAKINEYLRNNILYTSMEIRLYKDGVRIDNEVFPAVYDGEKGEIGVSIKVKYSADKEEWHDIFKMNDVWMKQYDSSTGEYIGDAIRIVGEKGEAADYIDYSFARTASNTVKPESASIVWEDAPMASQNENRFLWCKMRKFIWDAVSKTHTEVLNKYPQFVLMTPEDPKNTYVLNMSNDNCSVLVSHLSDSNALKNLTTNNMELYYGNAIVNKADYTLELIKEETSSNIKLSDIDTNNNVYVTSIKGENVTEFYYTYKAVLKDKSIVSKCKCTGTILNESVLYQVCVSSSVLKFNLANEFTNPLTISVYRIDSNSYVEMKTTQLLNANNLKIGVEMQASGDGPKGILWSDYNTDELTAFLEKINGYISKYKLDYIYVYLSYKDADKNSYIDVEYVPAVSDGTTGPQGPQGEKGETGKSIKVKYSANKINWHSEFQESDIWMLQVDSETDAPIGEAVKIVGEDGANGTLEEYMDYSFTRTNSSTDTPSNLEESSWHDAPPKNLNGDEDYYLWNRIQKMIRQEDKSYIVDTTVATTYNLLTPEKPEYTHVLYANNDNCSVSEFHVTNATQLLNLTGNTFELYKGEKFIETTVKNFKVESSYNCTVAYKSDTNQYYINKIQNKSLPAWYVMGAYIDGKLVSTIKCTCTIIPGNTTYTLSSSVNTFNYTSEYKYKGDMVYLYVNKVTNVTEEVESLESEMLKITLQYLTEDGQDFEGDFTDTVLGAAYGVNLICNNLKLKYIKITLSSFTNPDIIYSTQELNCTLDGKIGKDGEPGKDAVFYEINLHDTNIIKLVNNTPYPESIPVYIDVTTGDETESYGYGDEYQYNADNPYVINVTFGDNQYEDRMENLDSFYISENRIDTYYFYQLMDAIGVQYVTLQLIVNDVPKDVKKIYLLKDGDPGNNGLPGALPRMFKWKTGETYVHNNDFCDYVFYNNYCYSITKGKTATGIVPNDGTKVNYPYKLESKQSFVATDTLLADEANLAGFVFKDEFLISQSGKVNGVVSNDWNDSNFVPNLKLNGKTGEIVANNGKFAGEINSTSGNFKGYIQTKFGSFDGVLRTPFKHINDSDAYKNSDIWITNPNYSPTNGQKPEEYIINGNNLVTDLHILTDNNVSISLPHYNNSPIQSSADFFDGVNIKILDNRFALYNYPNSNQNFWAGACVNVYPGTGTAMILNSPRKNIQYVNSNAYIKHVSFIGACINIMGVSDNIKILSTDNNNSPFTWIIMNPEDLIYIKYWDNTEKWFI